VAAYSNGPIKELDLESGVAITKPRVRFVGIYGSIGRRINLKEIAGCKEQG
jgi:hypothetical protein